MRKESLLMLGSVAITLLVALGLIRWLAPGLLGVARDLQLVQLSKDVPPFYEGVFRREDLQSRDLLLKDPLTRVRAKPFVKPQLGLGPHDILGFRNRAVPNLADVVVIGDSQTYGNNATVDDNWPGQLETLLRDKHAVLYSMATGGWGAVQYLDMFTNATVFSPRVVIVAFYSGNDSLDSFQLTYGSEYWRALRPDPGLSASDLPKVNFPVPEDELWPVEFADGTATVFTPTLRLAANRGTPAVRAGYAIMADVARRISEMAQPLAVPLVFTIIPTKELVYAKRLKAEGFEPPSDYVELVRDEQENIDALTTQLTRLPNADYVDLVGPLQEAAMNVPELYSQNSDGHPLPNGYGVIARALGLIVDRRVPKPVSGLVALPTDNDLFAILLVKGNEVWRFSSANYVTANGWSGADIPLVEARDIAGLTVHEPVAVVDPARFGPG